MFRAVRKRSSVAWAALALGGVAAIVALGAWLLALSDWADRPGPLVEHTVVVVEPGRAFGGVARELQREGVIDDAGRLRMLARWRSATGAIHAGEYRFGPHEAPREVLHRLVSGDIVVHRLRILEGWSVRELLDAVATAPSLDRVLEGAGATDLLPALGLGEGHAEGRFFPDTYHYVRGDSDADLLVRAYRRMTEVLAAEWPARDADLPYADEDEALIMASIIEKETGLAEHRGSIGGVLVRRLQRGMRLQTDPSVIYGAGQAFDGDLTRAHLSRDGPYNTYTRSGLPPTPIALPGRAAIHAALHPAPGTAMYFVAQGDGATWFSDTLREHNEAVRRFQLGMSR